MLVFRDAFEDRPTAEAFANLDRLLSQAAEAGGDALNDLAAEALIEAGALEAALVDGLAPERDDDSPTVDALRRAGEATGRLFRAAQHREDSSSREATEARRCWSEASHRAEWPSQVRLKAAEGFAWYALHPEFYLGAAARACAALRPARAVVMGLRGIGAPLSAVVAAELQARGVETVSVTARPRGDPFDRTLVFGPELERGLRARAAAGWAFLAVDEGPGLSGSSLTGAGLALEALGAPAERVAILPAHDAEAAGFVSERARAAWPRFRRFPAWGAAVDPAPDLDGARDLSAGLWRGVLFDDAIPPVAATFERRKHLDRNGRVWKFVGLGARGRDARRLSTEMAEAGLGPPPLALRSGYVAVDRLDGRPLRRRAVDAGVLSRALEHLAFVARTRRTGRAVRTESLIEALRRNAALAGLDPLSPGAERALAVLAPAEAVRVDGRLQPHEWLVTPGGLLKTDAVDHGDDHFLPGPTDPAWDVAGLIEEWGLGTAADDVAARLAQATGDPGLVQRTPAYRAFYAAARLGFTTMAASGSEGPDRRGLKGQAEVWRRRLAAAVARLDG